MARGDHAAVAQQRGRVRDQRAGEDGRGVGMLAESRGQLRDPRTVKRSQQGAQRRQVGERVAQRRQVAWARRAQRHAGEDALDVAQALETLAKRRVGAGVEQGADRLRAPGDDLALAQRTVEPAPQESAAHRCGAAVQHACQGRVVLALRVLVDLEVAPGGRVHRHTVADGFQRQACEVGQGGALGVLQVLQQRACGPDRGAQRGYAEAHEVAGTEERAQCALAAVGIEVPRRATAQAWLVVERADRGHVLRDQGFGRAQAGEFGRQRGFVVDLRQHAASAGHVDPGQREPRAGACERQQQVVASFVEQRLLGDCAGRDDAHDPALDQALGLRRVADLLADRHRFADPEQPREIGVQLVVRYTRHRDRRACRAAALGQRDVEQARGLARIIVEQLVEVAHAEQQQRVGHLGFGAQVLPHQRCVLVQRVGGGGHLDGARRVG